MIRIVIIMSCNNYYCNNYHIHGYDNNNIVITHNNNETHLHNKKIYLLSQCIINTHKRRHHLNHNYVDHHKYITINDKR